MPSCFHALVDYNEQVQSWHLRFPPYLCKINLLITIIIIKTVHK
jgi:hypothetical protein